MVFSKNGSLGSFQKIINEIYGLPDDRLFSLSDLVSNQERFTMRALKGIRKKDMRKLKLNLMISLSWAMAIANRLHINIEEVVWQRFPLVCSYCGKRPCACKKIKAVNRKKTRVNEKVMPKSILEAQKMFNEIYPSSSRSLSDAGVHLAEETGELTEVVQAFLGEHKNKLFDELKNEMADCISCFFGVANSAGIDVALELSKMFKITATCVINLRVNAISPLFRALSLKRYSIFPTTLAPLSFITAHPYPLLAFYHISIYDNIMPHLSKRELDNKVEKKIHEMLELVLGKLNKDEVRVFLSSLLSNTEKVMLAKRLAGAIMLREGIDYAKVSNILKITTTTVYRTHLLVQMKPDGFGLAAKKIDADKMLNQVKTGLLKVAGYAIRASGGFVKPEIF